MNKLSKTDKRALAVGAVAAGCILFFVFGTDRLARWSEAGKSLAKKKNELQELAFKEGQQAGLTDSAPAFEMPSGEEKQKFLFRSKFNEQLKEAGIKAEALQFVSKRKVKGLSGYKMLFLQCRQAKCNLGQITKFLSELGKSPYLVGIEDFKMQCDPKKRREFKMDITVSTLIKEGTGYEY